MESKAKYIIYLFILTALSILAFQAVSDNRELQASNSNSQEKVDAFVYPRLDKIEKLGDEKTLVAKKFTCQTLERKYISETYRIYRTSIIDMIQVRKDKGEVVTWPPNIKSIRNIGSRMIDDGCSTGSVISSASYKARVERAAFTILSDLHAYINSDEFFQKGSAL